MTTVPNLGPSLGDEVAAVVRQVWSDPIFMRLVGSTCDEDSLEGSLKIDRVMAAQFVRAYAKRHSIEAVAKQPLSLLVKVLKDVLKTGSRKQRHRAEAAKD